MAVEVALAMLQRDGRWLMQLRDEIPSIVVPGCWGLFGGTLIRARRRSSPTCSSLSFRCRWSSCSSWRARAHLTHRFSGWTEELHRHRGWALEVA